MGADTENVCESARDFFRKMKQYMDTDTFDSCTAPSQSFDSGNAIILGMRPHSSGSRQARKLKSALRATNPGEESGPWWMHTPSYLCTKGDP